MCSAQEGREAAQVGARMEVVELAGRHILCLPRSLVALDECEDLAILAVRRVAVEPEKGERSEGGAVGKVKRNLDVGGRANREPRASGDLGSQEHPVCGEGGGSALPASPFVLAELPEVLAPSARVEQWGHKARICSGWRCREWAHEWDAAQDRTMVQHPAR